MRTKVVVSAVLAVVCVLGMVGVFYAPADVQEAQAKPIHFYTACYDCIAQDMSGEYCTAWNYDTPADQIDHPSYTTVLYFKEDFEHAGEGFGICDPIQAY
jgi:uncharacterized protein YgiB involved in biofilm formation